MTITTITTDPDDGLRWIVRADAGGSLMTSAVWMIPVTLTKVGVGPLEFAGAHVESRRFFVTIDRL